MNIDAPLPWQATAFRDLRRLQASARLGHAWILSGIPGIGKLKFARRFASFLLCQQPAADGPCGQCNACHLFDKGTHPDWLLLQPPKRLIVVDQIREAIDFASNTSQRGGYKIVCIEPAEAMNQNAANALLKLLEEPPAGTLLLLVSQQAGLLLPTLRSRCQHLKLPLPPAPQALDWLMAQGCTADAHRLLQKAGGAPLRALALAETAALAEQDAILDCVQELLQGNCAAIQAARKCEKFNSVTIMDAMLQTIRELAMHLQCSRRMDDSRLQFLAELLAVPGARHASLLLHALHASFERTRRTLLSSNNPNALLVLEQVFGEWDTLRQQLAPVRGQRTP